jgi:chitosanase
MAITAQQKQKILQVVNVFETGSIEGNYGAVTLLKDGPPGEDDNPIKQITYGRSQTTEFGNLKILLQQYIAAGGFFADALKPYVHKMGKKPSVCTDTVLLQTLRAAGNTDPLMRKVQDDFFEQLYYQPALNWFTGMKFTTALSMLVIYDSFIHSGTVPSWLRERFPEAVPKNGGDEITWIKQYVHARHSWLANHKRAILRKTIYRTQCFKTSMAKDNWDLLLVVNANGIHIS